MTTLVRDLMHKGIIRCRPDISLGEAAKLFTRHHVHSLFVADGDEFPRGVITDYDLLAGEWLSGDPDSLDIMRRMTAGELMSSPIESIQASVSVNEAAKHMRDGSIRRLLVLENQKPVGVISVSDFISELSSRQQVNRKTVSDVMSETFLICRDKTTVPAAARAMSETGWRSVVVADAHGKPLGIFSGLDLLECCDFDQNLESTLVTEVMHFPLMIEMHTSLQEAAQMMIDNHHHRILVIDPSQEDSLPVGVISSFDIISEMARPNSVWQS